MLKRVLRLNITLSKNKPVRGSSYIPLPKGLNRTRSPINIQNKKDHHCFKWAILRHFHPILKKGGHPELIGDLREHVNELNWDGIEFPTPCSERMYKKFERNNNISLLAFGHEVFEVLKKGKVVEKIRIIPLYVPTERHEKVVRLFFFKNEDGESHYCTVTNMPGLISRQVKSHNKGRGIFVCDYCLNHFGTQDLLDRHEESCSKYKAVKTEYPEPGENILMFKNMQNCLECPVKFYFDTESFLKPIDEMRGKTRLNQQHVMSAFCLCPVFRIEGVSMDPITYVAKDENDEVDRVLVGRMVETAKKIYERFKIPAKMIFDDNAKKLHESATVCFACKKEFNNDKVRDHCHFTGKYRGALHSECNLKLGRKSLVIPVFAHNNSGYDSHMFVKRLADMEGGVSCIADNEEKYITFSKNILVDVVEEENVYVKLKFLDSFRFMGKSLADLVRTTTKFEHTDKYFTLEQQELLRRKEVYPYDYITDFSKLLEKEPPSREAFNSWLNSAGVVSSTSEFGEMEPVKITDEDYDHFMKMWKRSGSKNLGDLTKFYVKGDTLQLTDVFENVIGVCMEKYGLDPSYYVTAAHLANDAMLKVKGVEIELLTDPDMYLFFEESKRGGFSLAMKRYMKANNKFMKEYDPEKPDVFIEYLDKNGLYTSILSGPLPFSGFKWLTQEEINEMMRDHAKIRSCTLKVDLEYPKELHDLHNGYPLAVESVVVDGVKKLIPNLYDKEKYVVHHEALRCYLRNGMVF